MLLEIHASRLDDYNDCALRAAYSLAPDMFHAAGARGKERSRWVAATVGTGCHAGVEYLLTKCPAGNGEVVSQKDIDLAISAGVAAYYVRFKLDAPRFSTSGIRDHKEAERRVAEIVTFYAKEISPSRKPVLTEKHYKSNVTPDAFYDTTLDSYCADEVLYDLKTGQYFKSAHNQLGTYGILIEKDGYPVSYAQLDYLNYNKKSELVYTPIVYDIRACVAQARWTTARMIREFRLFEKTGDWGVFSKNPRSEGCNKIICPLWGTTSCNAWSGSTAKENPWD